MTDATEHLTDLIEAAMDNAMDIDVGTHQLAQAAAEAVLANVPELEWVDLYDDGSRFEVTSEHPTGYADSIHARPDGAWHSPLGWFATPQEAKAAANDLHRALLMKAMGLAE